MQTGNGEGAALAARRITTRFRDTIWKKFLSAMKGFEMTKPGDRIAVCLSGGKDSLLLAVCLRHLMAHSTVPFELRFLCMDPGYTRAQRGTVLAAADSMGISLDIFETDIFRVLDKGVASPCHVCSAMRRGHLYKAAFERGCNKIALGHHFDDVVETVLLNLFYGSEFKTMMPRLASDNYPGMELIRPLYFVREKTVRAWADTLGLDFLECACPTPVPRDGKRSEMKALLASLERLNPQAAMSIYRSTCAVNLSCVLGWKQAASAPAVSFMEGLAPARAAADGARGGGRPGAGGEESA